MATGDGHRRAAGDDLRHLVAMPANRLTIVRGRVERPLSRRRSAGMIALRPDRDGTISGYDGVDELQQRFGEYILDAHLPPVGTPTQPVEAGYMANAWLRMAHPDYDTLRGMLNAVGVTLSVHAS